jgi:hypothetical protein
MLSTLIDWIKKIGSVFKFWLMISGTIGFSLFILEEASQIATFSTFMSKTNQDYELVLKAADIMEKNNNLIKVINKYVGWINPFGYISYNQYAEAQKIYSDECIMLVLRNQPELLENRIIEIAFTPKEIINEQNGYLHKNGKIQVIGYNNNELRTINMKGKVEHGKIRYIEKTLQ